MSRPPRPAGSVPVEFYISPEAAAEVERRIAALPGVAVSRPVMVRAIFYQALGLTADGKAAPRLRKAAGNG